MKFRKIAKDRSGTILQEGDIIQLFHDTGNITEAVIDKIHQPIREEFPELTVVEVTSDWRGISVDTKRRTLDILQYKTCNILTNNNLRDDVPRFKKLKEIAEKSASNAPFKRRI